MTGRGYIESREQSLIKGLLLDRFKSLRPDIAVDSKGYVSSNRDNLLPLVSEEDFFDDLSSGGGNELDWKFQALHSSAALAINCFAPFRQRINELTLPFGSGFNSFEFERKCPHGIGRHPPNLDVVFEGDSDVVAIESKFTEYLKEPKVSFSDAYVDRILDERREQGYFAEMMRLRNSEKAYKCLDAAQLIKHSFGLSHTFMGGNVRLVYLYWEPVNIESSNSTIKETFEVHREEIEEFAECVKGSVPVFESISYPELWKHWRITDNAWLNSHLDELQARYAIEI